MNEPLLRVFRHLEQADIRYCIMRDCDKLSEPVKGRDIDLLVQDNQLAQLRGLLARLGFVHLPAWGYTPHHFFVTYDADSDSWLKLDVVTEVAYGKPVHALRTELASACLSHRRRFGPTFIPSPENELVTLLLHCVLDKADFALARRRRLQALRHEVTDERYLSTLLATYWSPTVGWPHIAYQIDAGDWEALLTERTAIAARLASHDRLGTLARNVRGRLLRKLGRWAGLQWPRGFTVALLAPDGAGKSTLARGIESTFHFPTQSIYMGLYQDSTSRPAHPDIPGLGLGIRLLKQWRRYLIARYHQARGRLVIFDRYTYDALAAPRANSGRLGKIRRWLLAHACPAPDLAVVLDAPGEVLYARKGERSAAALEQQRRRYLELQQQLPHMVVVDAQQDAERVRRDVTTLIWRGYTDRSLQGFVGNTRHEQCNESQRSTNRPKVAYVMSRFPKLTETFVLYEMLSLEQQGMQVELYPLLRERAAVIHPEAAPLVERAHFQPLLSWPILRAQMHFLRREPRAYLGTLWSVLRGTWGSLRFFTGALGIFPKSVYFAHQMAATGVTHVHAHFASHPAVAGFIIHRLVGIPYSFTAHGSDLHRDRHMLREKVAEAAFVVPVSNYNRQVILDECGEQVCDKVLVIHCGVDTRVFQPRPSERGSTEARKNGNRGADGPAGRDSCTRAQTFTILCIGTLHEVKGQTYLIEACRLLREREIDFVCRLVGDGPDQAALIRQIRQAGLEDRVQLLGPRTRAEIAELLRAAHVVAAPSVPTQIGRREGIPVALMEAMASGVPVVASSISGIPELVEHRRNGLLVPPGDIQALADALERLHRDPLLRRHLGQAGRDRVLREFDLDTNVATLAQCFSAEIQS